MDQHQHSAVAYGHVSETAEVLHRLRLYNSRQSAASSSSSSEHNGLGRAHGHEPVILDTDHSRLPPMNGPPPTSPVPPTPQQSQGQRRRRPSSSRPPSDSSSSPRYLPQVQWPPPSRPLPTLPPHAVSTSNRTSNRTSGGTSDRHSRRTQNLSLSSRAASDIDAGAEANPAPVDSPIRKPLSPVIGRSSQSSNELYERSSTGSVPIQPALREPAQAPVPAVEVFCVNLLEPDEKKKSGIFYLDLTVSGLTISSKHRNSVIKFRSVADGAVQHVVKFSSYTDPQIRSRNYFIRSHAILSEVTHIVAVATRLGTTLEIWNWTGKKPLQNITNADRWAGGRFAIGATGWGPLAVYHEEAGTVDVYKATTSKKPYAIMRTIHLKKAGLPVLPQYPELAFSATHPMLIVASGPRPPRKGHPPPQRETLLAAWDVRENGTPSDAPFKIAKPWQHTELDTALPLNVATSGTVVVSIWIPADFISVPNPQSEGGWKVQAVEVPYQYVLVWDLTTGSTRTIQIPNVVACISPNCRYVAYCDAGGVNHGARGRLAILDARIGQEVWSWPDPDAVAVDKGLERGFRHLDDLSGVTDLTFSADSGMLVVSDAEGYCGIYKVKERK